MNSVLPTQEQMQEFERIRSFFWHKRALIFAEMSALQVTENEFRKAIHKQWGIPDTDSIELFLSNGRIKEHIQCFCGHNAGHTAVYISNTEHWI